MRLILRQKYSVKSRPNARQLLIYKYMDSFSKLVFKQMGIFNR